MRYHYFHKRVVKGEYRYDTHNARTNTRAHIHAVHAIHAIHATQSTHAIRKPDAARMYINEVTVKLPKPRLNSAFIANNCFHSSNLVLGRSISD
jgi:hypothetical protein